MSRGQGVVPEEQGGTDFARVLALLEDQVAQNQAILERVQALESDNSALRAELAVSALPTGQRRRPGTGNVMAGLEGAVHGERSAGGVRKQVLIDVHGDKIPDRQIENGQGPRFYDGDRVRINPDSIKPGADQPWGAILAKLKKNQEGYGVVTKILWLTDEEGWKYKVVVPGLTGARPDGFHDRELLPA